MISLKPESSQKDHETLVNIEPGISQELSFILVTVEVQFILMSVAVTESKAHVSATIPHSNDNKKLNTDITSHRIHKSAAVRFF